MNRKEFIKQLADFIEKNNEKIETKEQAAEILLKEVERLGMVPVSQYRSFMMNATIYDWEENVDEERRSLELERQAE